MNKHHLRHALRALDMTSADLVRQLTEARSDGKKTTDATVSNWITGRAPVPAAVTLLLRMRLIDRLKSKPPSLRGLKIITVGGGKGGSGASPMAALLGAAARKRGYRVRIGSVEHAMHGAEFWTQDFCNSFETLVKVRLDDLQAQRAVHGAKVDMLIVDVGSGSMLSFAHLKDIHLDEIDLAVIPIDPTHLLDREPALRVAGSLRDAGFERFLLQPLMHRLSLACILAHGYLPSVLSDFADRVSEQPMFRRVNIKRPGGPWDELTFQDDDLETEYAIFLDEVLRRLGLSQTRLELIDNDFDKLPTNEILEMLLGADYLAGGEISKKGAAARRLSSAWRAGLQPGG